MPNVVRPVFGSVVISVFDGNRLNIGGTRIRYGRLTESLAFRALESLDIRLLEFNTPAVVPVYNGRIGIDFTIGTSALA